jgi:hypothetical protein
VGVDAYAQSAKASRTVQARLPISAAIVTQFVTHLARPGHPVHVSLAVARSVRPRHHERTLSRQCKANLAEITGARMMPGLSRDLGGLSGNAFFMSHRFTPE